MANHLKEEFEKERYRVNRYRIALVAMATGIDLAR
jgi:hypothetical protein